jgi:hypothetical protein
MMMKKALIISVILNILLIISLYIQYELCKPQPTPPNPGPHITDNQQVCPIEQASPQPVTQVVYKWKTKYIVKYQEKPYSGEITATITFPASATKCPEPISATLTQLEIECPKCPKLKPKKVFSLLRGNVSINISLIPEWIITPRIEYVPFMFKDIELGGYGHIDSDKRWQAGIFLRFNF